VAKDKGSWIALAVLALPVVFMVGGGAYLGIRHLVTSATGKGTIHVVAPASGPLKVQVDGQSVAEAEPGEAAMVEVAQGAHDIALTEADGEVTRHHVDVADGFFRTLLPTKKQCFAVVDVSHYAYKSDHVLPGEAIDLPVEAQLTHHTPIRLREGTYVDLARAPETIGGDRRVRLAMDLPCSIVAGSEADVFREVRRRLTSWRDLPDAGP
jgi:hypothetical protein